MHATLSASERPMRAPPTHSLHATGGAADPASTPEAHGALDHANTDPSATAILTATQRARAGALVLWAAGSLRPRPGALVPGVAALPRLPSDTPPTPTYAQVPLSPPPTQRIEAGLFSQSLPRSPGGHSPNDHGDLDDLVIGLPNDKPAGSASDREHYLLPPRCPWTQRSAKEDYARLHYVRGFLFMETGLDAAPDQFRAIDASIMEYMVNYAMPNAALAIAAGDGRLVYAKGFTFIDWYGWEAPTYAGLGDERNTEVIDGWSYLTTPYTRFRWASVSKTVTAAAIFRAIEAGLLSLEDSVFADPRWRHRFVTTTTSLAQHTFLTSLYPIKIKHLLTHTPGWGEGASGRPWSERGRGALALPRILFDNNELRADLQPLGLPISPQRWPELMMRTDVASTRGSQLAVQLTPTRHTGKFSYDNFNYQLLGIILEEVYHRRVDRVWAQEVFRPVGMGWSTRARRTVQERREGEVLYFGDRAWRNPASTRYGSGHPVNVGETGREDWERTRPNQNAAAPRTAPQAYSQDLPLAAASSGLTSNIIDMARLGLQLQPSLSLTPSTGFLSSSSVRQMWKRAGSTSGLGSSTYGLGLQISSDKNTAGHTGEMAGASSWLGVNRYSSTLPAHMQGAVVACVFNRAAFRRDADDDQDQNSGFNFGQQLTTDLNRVDLSGDELAAQQRIHEAIAQSTDDLFSTLG